MNEQINKVVVENANGTATPSTEDGIPEEFRRKHLEVTQEVKDPTNNKQEAPFEV